MTNLSVNKNRIFNVRGLILVLVLAFMAAQRTWAAGPAPVDLGSAAPFTILAATTISTTGGGVINGNVGLSPGTGAGIGIPAAQVNGTIYEVDAAGPAGAVTDPALLTQAMSDLTTAYNDAANRTPVPSGAFRNPGNGNIGGMNLGPGLYKFDNTASISGSYLTLTGGPNDVWIFQCAADLQVASGIHIVLAGGAQARNIFWQVSTAAVIDTTAVFMGNILAHTSVTMNTGSTMTGRALASTAAVTYNGNNGSLSTPTAPVFTGISRTSANATIVLNTTPYFLVTLQSSPSLSIANWTTIATNTPATSIWTFTDTNATASMTQLFYRAFITTP
jgi:ice-binding like protein